MKSRSLFNQIVGVAIIVMLITLPINSSAQIDGTFHPFLKSTQGQYTADENNNLFIRSTPEMNAINNRFIGNTSFQQNRYEGMDRFDDGTTGFGESFSFSYPNILEAENTTNSRTMLDFKATYYSLFDGEVRSHTGSDYSQNQPHNIYLRSGAVYGFILNVDEVGPHFLSITTDSVAAGTSYNMMVQFVHPSGTNPSRSVSMTRGVENLIPFFPTETGEVTVFISPNSDVVVSDIHVRDNPSVFETVDAFSEKITGENTKGKFMRIEGTGFPQVFDLHQIIKNYNYLQGFGAGLPYLGSLSLRVFTTDGSILGSSFSQTPFVTADDVYISIVATPPDDSDPAISATKADAGLPDGMELEYSIFIDIYQVNRLPTNQNFLPTISEYSSTERFYYLSVQNEMLVGVNASSFGNIEFMPQNSSMDSININSFNDDFLNDNGDDFALLQPGEYIVSVPTEEIFYIQMFDATDLEMNQRLDLEMEIDQINRIKLTQSGYISNLLNITLNNPQNFSADITVRTYERDGNYINTFSETLTNYLGAVAGSNFTEITTPSDVTSQYVTITIDNIDLYYANGTMIPAEEITDYPAVDLSIDRYDDFVLTREESDTTNYLLGNLVDSRSASVHSNFTTYAALLDIQTAANMGYRLIVDSVNRTIFSLSLMENSNNLWFDGLDQFTVRNISNADHYILEISFATQVALNMALQVILQNAALNGTISVTLEQVPVQQLPSLNLVVVDAVQQEERGFLQNPAVWFTLGGVAVVAALAYVFRSNIIEAISRFRGKE